MIAHWPQLIFLGLLALTFAVHCAHAGEPRSAYNPVGVLIGAAIEVFVLYQGGFFAPLGWAP